jgi:DNA-binding NarL/FixJ family response regulator
LKRIAGGHTSVGAAARLLSSHAGDPRAAAGDRTDTGQTTVDKEFQSQPTASPRTNRLGRTSPSGGADDDTDEEFRREAVQMLRAGRTPRELAESLGVSEQTLRNWRRQDQRDRHERDDGLTTDELSSCAGCGARTRA